MRRLLLLPLLLLIGCSEKDRDAAIDKGAEVGKAAANSAQRSLADVWQRTTAEASKLTPDSAMAALEKAKTDIQAAAANLKPGEKLDAARAELARLQAAVDLQKTQEALDRRLAEAQKLKENAGKSIDDLKETLRKTDEAYRDLHDRAALAQSYYDAAKAKAEETRQAAEKALGAH